MGCVTRLESPITFDSAVQGIAWECIDLYIKSLL